MAENNIMREWWGWRFPRRPENGGFSIGAAKPGRSSDHVSVSGGWELGHITFMLNSLVHQVC